MKRMWRFIYFLVLLFNLTRCYDDILESDYIKELHPKTFHNFLKENDYVLLEFYTEGCPHCQEFAPVFLEAAKDMKFTKELSQVKIAKIDGQKYEEITNTYDVKGFPDVKLISIKHGIQADYFGERKVESLIKFVKSRINKKVVELQSIKQLTLLESTKKHMLVICGKNETFPEIFKLGNKLIMQYDDLELFYTSNIEVTDNLNCTNNNPGLILIKNYDERRMKYDEKTFNSTHFEEWFNIFSLPTLVRLSDENIQISLQQQLPSVILITKDDESEETYELRQMLKSRAKKLRKQMIFMSSSNDSEVSSKLLEYYNILNLPAIVGLTANYESNSFNKFKYESEINEENFDKWISDLSGNKLNKYFQSDPLPINPLEDGVKIVVGSTFREIVLNTTNDVFLEIYAPWCTHCTKIAPRYARLAQKLVNYSNLVIGKMDGNSNEVEGLEFQAFPTFFLFKGGISGDEKFRTKMKFNGTKNVSTFIEFLRNNTHYPIKDVLILPNETQIEEEERIEEETENLEQEEESNFNKVSETYDSDDTDWEKDVNDALKGQDLNNLDELIDNNLKDDFNDNNDSELSDTLNILEKTKDVLENKKEVSESQENKESNIESQKIDL